MPPVAVIDHGGSRCCARIFSLPKNKTESGLQELALHLVHPPFQQFLGEVLESTHRQKGPNRGVDACHRAGGLGRHRDGEPTYDDGERPKLRSGKVPAAAQSNGCGHAGAARPDGVDQAQRQFPQADYEQARGDGVFQAHREDGREAAGFLQRRGGG